MKFVKLFEDFVSEKKNKKTSIKSKVKKIDKKIKKAVDKQEDLVKTAKELADSPEPSDKMKASLAKVQLRQSSAKAQELVMRKEAEILKNKIKTAKKKERATTESLKFEEFITEKKPKGAPDFHHSDAPDAEGRFRDLSIKDLAAWLIKTRKKDVKKIIGSLTQQYVFNRNDDPDYAEKMQKTRKEVYKQLGREDLIDKMDESLNESNYYPGFDGVKITGYVEGDKAKLNHIEVKAAQRGGGIGSKAVADFERWAKEQGAKYVEIDAYKKSINFWEKMGYELEKEFPVIHGHKQDYKTGIKEL